jgi:CBS domain-containing protein
MNRPEMPMKVEAFMTRNPQTVQPQDTLAAARDKMDRGRFRRLPVVDKTGRLVGILTDGDLRPHIGYFGTTRVSAAAVDDPVTITAEAPLEEAVRLMLERKIGGLPVVGDEGRVVGILTESDLLRGFLQALAAGGEES